MIAPHAERDVKRAFDSLTAKGEKHRILWRYYDGEMPLAYSTAKLREIFANINVEFRENWCEVVARTIIDRLDLSTPTVANNAAASDRLTHLWEEAGIVDDEHSVHEDLIVTGESFIIAWPGDDEEAHMPQAYHNPSINCHAHYDPANPRRMLYAAKWWRTEDEHVRLTLYYADRLEHYVTANKADVGSMLTHRSFAPLPGREVEPNPTGRIPVFHFRSNARRPRSQIEHVLSLQDALNKLFADMMVAAEYGAFPQRWAISQAGIGDALRNAPNEIWDLPAGLEGAQQTSVGQFAATDLGNYLQAMDRLTSAIGIISGTPKHYFYAQAGEPSGEALIAMEAPLVHKARRLQAALSPVWRDLAAFLLHLDGIDVQSRDVVADYESPSTVQPRSQADIRLLAVQAGIPLATQLKMEGWTERDVDEMKRERAEEDQYRAAAASSELYNIIYQEHGPYLTG